MNKEFPGSDIGFVITKGPVETGVVLGALKMAKGAMARGKKVSVFLISDGVWIAKKGQKNPASDLFQELVKNGMDVTVSEEHLVAAGIPEDKVEQGTYLTKKTYKDLVELVMEKWTKVVSI